KPKNWPLQNWIKLFASDRGFSAAKDSTRMATQFSLVVVSGEADKPQTAQLEQKWQDRNVRFAKNFSLPHLAAVLEQTIFVGHDSGISHLAAAAGANCILLFGPTDPDVWAPRNENVRVLRPHTGKVDDLEVERIEAAIAAALSGGSRLNC
ncbi:MAG: hypothetical protein DME65_08575, partial [Verrucomicrobia bacterium]